MKENKVLKLLGFYGGLFRYPVLTEFNNYVEQNDKKEIQNSYLKLKWYFKIYLEKTELKDESRKYWIDPIIKMNDYNEAFKDIFNKIRSLDSGVRKIKDIHYHLSIEKLLDSGIEIKEDVWEIIEKDIYEIKIDITEKESPIQIINQYQEVINLYQNYNYEAAFQKARDIFQIDLEESFNSSIKHFANKKDQLSQNINDLLNRISSIRNNFAKTKNFSSLSKEEQRAFTKLSIEQLISIKNFIAILEIKNN